MLQDIKRSADGSHLAPQRIGKPIAQPTQLADHIEEPHLRDYGRMVYRRRHIGMTVFALVVCFVALYSFTVTPAYEGRVQLLIESETPNVVEFDEVIKERQSGSDYYQTQYRLLRSRSLAKTTIDALKMWNNDELSSAGSLISAMSAKRWFGSPTTELPTRFESTAETRVINEFLSRVAVSPIRNSRLVDVSYRSASPETAATAANALAQAYIDQNLNYRFTSTQAATSFLGEQLAEQRKRVEASELALQKYREQNDAIALNDRQDIVVQKLADLNAAVTRAKMERLEKEAFYRQLRSLENDAAALDTFPAILSNTFIQQQKSQLAELQRQYSSMAEKLGDKHPEMIKARTAITLTQARLQGEISKEVQSVRNQYLAAQAQETSLVRALDAQKQEALGMNRKGIEYGVLQRDAESNRQIYDSLLKRANETGVSGELRTSNIRIVDHAAVPDSPASPRKALNLGVATLLGLFLGLCFAFFFEYLDNRLKTPEEIVRHLGIASLGLIPAAATKASKPSDPMIDGDVAMFSEAFRALRTNVLFSAAESGMRSAVITSTGPSEGKSVVAANLAIALARAGQRVLLIDADLRRPRVHQIFFRKQQPGLSNLMVGAAQAVDVIQQVRVPGLSIVTAGKIPPNPAELLGSKRFRDFLHSLSAQFDWVLIDSPPVMAVADACHIAHQTSGVLFVVGADSTSRHAARQALHQLAQAKARILGAVLNRVDLQKNPYYYSKYYKKEYSQYYARKAS